MRRIEYRDAALLALDAVEELRQQDAENNGGILDYEFRCICADIARGAKIPNRADWTELLKADPDSNYHKRYYNGKFHI